LASFQKEIAQYAPTLKGIDIIKTPVSQIMASSPLTVKPSDSTDHCMTIISSKGIRHLPVVSNNHVLGIASVGDVVKQIMTQLRQNVSFL
jgi:CBS domain-containing protein